MTLGGLAAVSSSAFAALYSAFGKYDVVHIHAEGPAFFAWLPKMFGKRVVVTVHGIDWQREKWQSGLGSKFIHQGEKNAAKYADEVIVLSKGVQDYFKETYGRETHFIPNGVNRPQIREASLITDKFGLKKDSYILFLGRLVPEKGIRYLVEAFKNVKTDKKLVIAGGSSDTDSFMEELKDLAKGDDRILFTGFVQGAMLDELYSNTYIYTLPSDLEGMPLSLLEAMSYGNCCLVSDIPECAEVVEDKALIFKKSDVEDLREKLQDACDHPEMVMKMKNIYGCYMKERGKLLNNTVVTTVMSNFGLYKAFDEQGIGYAKTAVGDKYVYEYMAKNGCRIGGEQSGHIIFSKYASTGDGILTSLKMMEVMLAKKKPMSELAAPLKIYPQVLENVRVTDKKAAQNDPAVQEAVNKVAEALGDTGRILARGSGTEPVVRVMVEAPDHDTCQKYVDEVVNVICEKGYKV